MTIKKQTDFDLSCSFPIILSSYFIWQVKSLIPRSDKPVPPISLLSLSQQPKSIILGFSKGGTVLNQLVAELSNCSVTSPSYHHSIEAQQQCGGKAPTSIDTIQIFPTTKESFLNSIADLHYVDVGLNSLGAYITDRDVIVRLSNRIAQGAQTVQFFIHGTPRQWRDRKRAWIREEKDVLAGLLKSESRKLGRKLRVSERLYFADKPPDLQMHFEIIEKLDLSY